jgi:aminoglycoside phosphotransferase (APT) family kinase protein
MPTDPALDPLTILHSIGVHSLVNVTPVAGGTATAIWQVALGSRMYALRVYPVGAMATCRAELAALRIATRAGAPVPAVHLAGQWQGRPALLIDWCAGEPVGRLLARRPWLAWPLGLAFGRAQAQLHRATRALGLPASQGWVAWGASDDPALATLLGRLSAGQPSLLHLDYHLFNVLADGRRVSAILDWANAQVGDPRADLARTYSILMVEPWQAGPQPLWLALLRRLLAAAWWRGYRQRAGPVGHMAPFLAWAGAAMVRDLAYRVGDPRSWWTQQHLDAISAWAARQRRAALGAD